MSRKVKDLTGKKFGLWKIEVFAFIGKGSHRDAYWKCTCRGCGRTYDVRSDSLQSGHSTKCAQCSWNERKQRHARII